ncbi:MAG: hypothetical protein WCX74_03375 [Candidatus Paceibacterota bacterium]
MKEGINFELEGDNLENKEKEQTSIGEVIFIRHGKVGSYPYDEETGFHEGNLTEESIKEAKARGVEIGKKLLENYDPQNTDIILWNSPRYRAGETANYLKEGIEESGFNIFLDKSLTMDKLGEAITHEDGEEWMKKGLKEWYATAPESTHKALSENERMYLYLTRKMLEKVKGLREKEVRYNIGEENEKQFRKDGKTVMVGVGHNITINKLVEEIFPDKGAMEGGITNLERVYLKFLDNGQIKVILEDGRSKVIDDTNGDLEKINKE